MSFAPLRPCNSIAASALLTLALLGCLGSARATPTLQTETPPPSPSPQPTPSRPILLTDPVPDPHQADVRWFAATGHTLRGTFLDYWNRYGGLAQFGYPITEEFAEPLGPDKKPYTVQYFQRNRFEHHPENAGTQYEVLLGTLGRDFHAADPPASPIVGSAYFTQTGHNLSGAFKAYWETHGGLLVHGYPITEQFEEKNPIDGKTYTAQYFERSRFELHPENAGGPYEVLLGLLGTQLAQQKQYFSGAYPLYGHAADFSWVAGRIELYAVNCGGPPECGCVLFRYDESDKHGHVQVAGNSRVRARLLYETSTSEHPYIIVFGQLSYVTGECLDDINARSFFFSIMQTNLNQSTLAPVH
jgi:hypothetical protein